MGKILINLILYYGIAQFLHVANNRYFKVYRTIRRSECRPLFDFAGENINIERKANFGTGKGISIGDNS